jgi:hypothetical protein
MKWSEKILLAMSLYEPGERALAAKCGLAYTTVYRFRKGEKSLLLTYAEVICEELGLDLVDLRGAAAAPEKPEVVATKKGKSKKKTLVKKKTTVVSKKTTPKKPRAMARRGSGSGPKSPSVPDPSENGEAPDDLHAPTNVGGNPFTTFNDEERIKRCQSMDHEIDTFLKAGKEEEDPHTWKEI